MAFRTKGVFTEFDAVLKGKKVIRAVIPPPVWEQIDPKPGAKEPVVGFVFDKSKLDVEIQKRRR
ncbi:MAG: hypothetical protein ABUL49_02050 [bacterium]